MKNITHGVKFGGVILQFFGMGTFITGTSNNVNLGQKTRSYEIT